MQAASKSKNNLWTVLFALPGIAGAYLPWGAIVFGSHAGRFGGALNFFEGWIYFILIVNALVFGLLEMFFGFRNNAGRRIAAWSGLGAALFCLLYLIRIDFNFTGFGIWLSLASSIMVFLAGTRVIRIGRSTQKEENSNNNQS